MRIKGITEPIKKGEKPLPQSANETQYSFLRSVSASFETIRTSNKRGFPEIKPLIKQEMRFSDFTFYGRLI